MRDALAGLPYEFVCCVNVGGGGEAATRREHGEALYGVPLAASIERGIEAYVPEIVVDLSDEPVLGQRERLPTASRVLARDCPTRARTFRFDPPALEPSRSPV